MWTFANLLALGLFLFGTTFLWMTPAMAGTIPLPTGTAWTLTNVLSLAAVIGFTLAAWAVYRQYAWWGHGRTGVRRRRARRRRPVHRRAEPTRCVGLGDLGVQINLWIHTLAAQR